MRNLAHVTPRYVMDRLAQVRFQRRFPDAPWLTDTAVRFLEGWLKPSDHVIEWGSGRSTLWTAPRVGRIVSIEENPGWAELVGERLRGNGLDQKVDLRLASSAGDPATSAYVKSASDQPDASFDLCLVDGAHRDHCALMAFRLVRPGGIIMVDNAERYVPNDPPSTSPGARGPADGAETPEWQAFLTAVKDWRTFWTSNGVSDTAIWFCPAERR